MERWRQRDERQTVGMDCTDVKKWKDTRDDQLEWIVQMERNGKRQETNSWNGSYRWKEMEKDDRQTVGMDSTDGKKWKETRDKQLEWIVQMERNVNKVQYSKCSTVLKF